MLRSVVSNLYPRGTRYVAVIDGKCGDPDVGVLKSDAGPDLVCIDLVSVDLIRPSEFVLVLAANPDVFFVGFEDVASHVPQSLRAIHLERVRPAD